MFDKFGGYVMILFSNPSYVVVSFGQTVWLLDCSTINIGIGLFGQSRVL
jgi:hypothetical protein